MRKRGLRGASKKGGVSTIIGTVLIIAITLIAAVAIGGFVFGTQASGQNTALVQAIAVTIPTTVNLGTPILVCSPNSGNAFGGYLQLYNSGTSSTQADSFVFTFAGLTFSILLSGSCNISPESSLYLLVISLPVTVSIAVGTPYSGYVSMGNGAEVLFDGSFD